MPEIHHNNEIFELTEEQLLATIKNLASGWIILTESYYTNQISGFPDITGIFVIPDKGQNELNRKYEELISDPVVLSSYTSIKLELKKMRSLDLGITIWLAKYLNVDVVENKFDKPKLLRRLRKVVAGKNGGGVIGPIWAMKPEYKEFIDKSVEIRDAAQAYQSVLNQRISELYPGSPYL